MCLIIFSAKILPLASNFTKQIHLFLYDLCNVDICEVSRMLRLIIVKQPTLVFSNPFLYHCLHFCFLACIVQLESSGGTQRAKDLLFLWENWTNVMWIVLWNDQTSFVLRFLFALSLLVVSCLCITILKPCHCRRSRWLWSVLSNHIPPSLPHLSLCSCTVDTLRSSRCFITRGSEIYLSMFISKLGGIALYIFGVLFSPVSKVSI